MEILLCETLQAQSTVMEGRGERMWDGWSEVSDCQLRWTRVINFSVWKVKEACL